MENVVIVGNCQARPLANIISACSLVSVSDVFIVHLERPDQSERFWRSLDAADYVLCQLTVDNYPCAHVRSSEIKGRYPDKALIWPNVFHSGQQPFLRYMTNLALGRIMGPMDAYHDIEIFNQWRRSRGLDGVVPLPDVEDVVDVSTRSLKARENECGVKIADFISENLYKERLFFTFNHPTRFVLVELAKRCCDELGLDFNDVPLPPNEPLGRVSPPSALMEDATSFFGNELVFADDATVSVGPRKAYSRQGLVEQYFLSYDHQLPKVADLKQLRFTPQNP